MTPYADEYRIQGGWCAGGDVWHRQILLHIVDQGLLYNAYSTVIEAMHNHSEIDCWLGGLVATGIPPQLAKGTTEAARPLIGRVKFWLDTFRQFGMANESSIQILHYDDVFLVSLSGGTQRGDNRGLFVGNATASVAFPPIADNTTLLVFCGWEVSSADISFGSPEHDHFTLLAASDAVAHMQGGFWALSPQQQMTETVVTDGSTRSHTIIVPSSTGTAHSVALSVGDTALYSKTRRPHGGFVVEDD